MVIAIIAILAAILLPALEQARERARTIACANNERNIFFGINFYTDDWQAYPRGNDFPPGGQYRWHRPVIEGGYVQAQLHNYPPGHVLRCPNDTNPNFSDGLWYRMSGVFYGPYGPPAPPGCCMSGINGHNPRIITRPSLSFMLMEGSYGTNWENGYDGNFPYHPAWDPLQLKVGAQHNGNNVIFCDGHVEFWNRDWRPSIAGLQPMPPYDHCDVPPYFYATNGGPSFAYPEYWYSGPCNSYP